NPLQRFDSSGATDQPFFIRLACFFTSFSPLRSNVTWGTQFVAPSEIGPATGNPFDWHAARRSYLDGLTKQSPAARDAALAKTFEAVGHVMHLVQDLAVPAHVRNDFQAHLEYCAPRLVAFSRWCENGFERFVKSRPDLVEEAAGIAIDFVDRPLTRFRDTGQYDGTNPSGHLGQGLAEYTNANFASANTVFTELLPMTDAHWFPFPREGSTNFADLVAGRLSIREVVAEDGVVDGGLYLDKVADGDTFMNFLKVGYLTPFALAREFPDLSGIVPVLFQLEDVVTKASAIKCLPRAIGSSAGLLAYFFRGRLDGDVVLAPANPNFVRFTGANASPEAMDGGTLELYAENA